VVIDRALQEFFYEFSQPDIIFGCFFFVFLAFLNPRERCCSFFMLLFTLLCDFSREIETVQVIISSVEGHNYAII
jgi:hypothetical protein